MCDLCMSVNALEACRKVLRVSIQLTLAQSFTLFRRPYLTGRATIGRLELPPGEAPPPPPDTSNPPPFSVGEVGTG